MLVHWQERTAYNLELSEALCLLCVGSTEQHSDYLPLGTDSIIGEHLAHAAAEQAACNVVLLPSQRVGFSPHHRAFPGCLTLSTETMIRYLFELCSCVYDSGCRQLMILNSHGGNQTCLQAVVNELGSKLGKRTVLVRYWDLIAAEVQGLRETGPGGMGHAGELEASLMLYFRPELVNQSRIDSREPATGNEWHHPDMFAANKIYLYKPFDEYSPKGNIGQAAYASREKGEKIAALATRELARLIDYQVSHSF